MAASVYAKGVVATLQRTKESRGVSDHNTKKFSGARGLFRSATPSGGKIVLFAMALGNDTTGSVFLVTFESPETEWDDAWRVGERLVRSIDGDDAF